MKRKIDTYFVIVLTLLLSPLFFSIAQAQGENPHPPAEPVNLIFIHHSCGENWLTDGNGDLGLTLSENNYFVSDTNYGWGPDSIGDATDIVNWPQWFTGPESGRYTDALYNESGQLSSYTRTISDPGGENRIIMFKSCFPNSNLAGNPDDPPGDYAEQTVSGAKYVYNQLLAYFQTRPDKLFIVITAPPVQDSTYAHNARAFNEWLVNDWLAENAYPLNNVAVWDFHNILTHPDNHHRYQGGAIEYTTSHGNGTLYYDSSGDNHPRVEGNQKATAEFIPLLNIFYHRWIAEAPESAPEAESEPAPETEAEEETAPEEAESPPPADAPAAFAPGAVVDDFESGTDAWEAYWDEAASTTFSCEACRSEVHAGEISLRLDFDVAPESWGTCSRFFEGEGGFAGTSGISFYYRASAPGLVFNVDAHGGTPDARTSYYHPVETTAESVEGWVHVELPWEQILRVEWEENPGSPVDPAQVNGFSFGIGTTTGETQAGTVWLDDFQLLGDAAPEEESPSRAEVGEEEPAPASEGQPQPEPDPASEGQPQPEPDSGGGPSLCPGSMALGAMTMALAGVVFYRRRPHPRPLSQG